MQSFNYLTVTRKFPRIILLFITCRYVVWCKAILRSLIFLKCVTDDIPPLNMTPKRIVSPTNALGVYDLIIGYVIAIPWMNCTDQNNMCLWTPLIGGIKSQNWFLQKVFWLWFGKKNNICLELLAVLPISAEQLFCTSSPSNIKSWICTRLLMFPCTEHERAVHLMPSYMNRDGSHSTLTSIPILNKKLK